MSLAQEMEKQVFGGVENLNTGRIDKERRVKGRGN